MNDLPEASFVYPTSDGLEAGMESEEETDLEMDVVCGAGTYHFFAFVRCQCHRFVTEDVESAFCRGDDLLVVEVDGC